MKTLFAILLAMIVGCASTPEKKEEPKQGKKKFNKEEVCNDLDNKEHVDSSVKELLCK